VLPAGQRSLSSVPQGTGVRRQLPTLVLMDVSTGPGVIEADMRGLDVKRRRVRCI